MGNPILRKVAEPIELNDIKSSENKSLIEDLRDTLKFSDGLGLAAPQISISKQLAIINIPNDSERYPESEESNEFILFNPVISCLDNTLQGFWEGCLSVPGLRGFVQRTRKIKVDYINEDALSCSIVVQDFLATVFQHELDHLFGILFIDKVKDISKLVYEEEMENFMEIEGTEE